MAAILDPYLTGNLTELNQALTQNNLFLSNIIRQKLIKSGYLLDNIKQNIMKTHNILFGNSYPHFYTLKGKDNPKKQEDKYITGIGKITGCYLNSNPVSVGDEIVINGNPHIVQSIETRQPKSTRHPEPATYYEAETTYKRNP